MARCLAEAGDEERGGLALLEQLARAIEEEEDEIADALLNAHLKGWTLGPCGRMYLEHALAEDRGFRTTRFSARRPVFIARGAILELLAADGARPAARADALDQLVSELEDID